MTQNTLDKEIQNTLYGLAVQSYNGYQENLPVYARDSKEKLKPLLTQLEKEARTEGGIRTLNVLSAHVREQIFERTITTESLLKYIEDNIKKLHAELGENI